MTSLANSFVILTLVLVIHLIEEVRTNFRTRMLLGEMPKFLFVGINILIYTYAVVMITLAFGDYPVAVTMAWIFSIAMLLNNVGHIGIIVIRKAYFPGGVTAFLLIPATINTIRLLTVI